MQRELQEIKTELSKKAFIIGATPALIALLFGKYFLGLGLLLGSLVSIFNLNLLAKKIEDVSQNRIRLVSFILGYLGRYLLMGIVLFVAIRNSLTTFLGVALGLFSVRFAIYSEALFKKKDVSAHAHRLVNDGRASADVTK